MKGIKLNKDISMDLERLIETRLLIQANSGGGKSHSLRRILEQSFGSTQHIIIDPEGEFSTLREKYDYVLAGKGGDTPADPRSAALLAHRLLELNVSAIIDLYELHPEDRKRFVKIFFDAMINAPKELYHSCVIVLDEAHIFAPEKGESLALGSVIDMATRGRKRGFCLVPATQRLSKLHKDVAAECNNKLIGRTGLDIDMKRAAEELGFNSKEDIRGLRNLEPGEFYAFGPAISREVIKLKIGGIETQPPKIGKKGFSAPAPTAKIKKLLGKLADLPAEAKKEAQTISELKAQILKLKKTTTTKEILVTDPAVVSREVTRAVLENDRMRQKEYKILADRFGHLVKIFKQIQKLIPDFMGESGVIEMKIADVPHVHTTARPFTVTPKNVETVVDDLRQAIDPESMGAGEKKVLTAIASQNDGMTREHITVQTGYKRSTRDRYIQRLQAKDLVGVSNATGKIIATQEGIEALGNDYQPLPTGAALRNHLQSTLPEGEKKIITELIDVYPETLGRDELTERTSYQRSTRDRYIQRLASRQLVSYQGGRVKASDLLFQE